MQKALTFFRVFDLAFFAPGTILMVFGGAMLGIPDVLDQELGPAQATICILIFIAAAYCGGLVVHSVVWTLKRVLETMVAPVFRWLSRIFSRIKEKFRPGSKEVIRSSDTAQGWVPFPLNFENEEQTDLILYFWYLRATCWNAAFTLVVGMLLVSAFPKMLPCSLRPHDSWLLSGLLVGAIALTVQGYSFHETVKRSFGLSRARKRDDN